MHALLIIKHYSETELVSHLKPEKASCSPLLPGGSWDKFFQGSIKEKYQKHSQRPIYCLIYLPKVITGKKSISTHKNDHTSYLTNYRKKQEFWLTEIHNFFSLKIATMRLFHGAILWPEFLTH